MDIKQYAVITGGTKGIGRALVFTFARNGYSVITCARNQNDLRQLKEALQIEIPDASLHYIHADLSQKMEVKRFADYCLSITNKISVIVHNTGVFLPGQLATEEDGVLELQMQTNVYSAYYLTRALLPGMLPHRAGHIFTICSTASIMAYPNGGSYCISKFALLGFTKVLRQELKNHNIKVTAVLPGATYTASWEGTELPADRFMKASDVAEAVWSCTQLSESAVVEELLMRPLEGDI